MLHTPYKRMFVSMAYNYRLDRPVRVPAVSPATVTKLV